MTRSEALALARDIMDGRVGTPWSPYSHEEASVALADFVLHEQREHDRAVDEVMREVAEVNPPPGVARRVLG